MVFGQQRWKKEGEEEEEEEAAASWQSCFFISCSGAGWQSLSLTNSRQEAERGLPEDALGPFPSLLPALAPSLSLPLSPLRLPGGSLGSLVLPESCTGWR